MKTKFNLPALLGRILFAAAGWTSLALIPDVARAQDQVYQVDSIASLRLVSSTTVHEAIVAGYNQPRDGGGGFYTFDSSDTTSSDNGGTVIVATTDNARWKLTQSEAPTVMQFGAVYGNTGTDNAPPIQAALNACTVVRFPVGVYRCNGPITLNSENVLLGMGASGQVALSSPTDGAKLIFYGTGDACIASSSSSNLTDAGLKNLGLEVDPGATYSWIVHLTEPVGLAFENVRLGTTALTIGGIKCNVRTSGAGVSDRNHFLRTFVTLPGYLGSGSPPAATAAALDVDFTDSQLISCEMLGGTGAILHGPGQISCSDVRFAESVGYNVTIVHDVPGSSNADGFANCSFEQCYSGEIFINLDQEDSDTPNVYPRFVGNTVWAPNVTSPLITVQNSSGPAPAQGGIIDGNVFVANPGVPISLPSAGVGWTLADDKYKTLPDFSVLTDAKIDEDIEMLPLQRIIQVMGQSGHASATSSTAETALASVAIPANALGIAGKLRISATFSAPSTSGVKNAFIRFGSGLAGTAFYQDTLSGATTLSHVLCEVSMAGATNSEISAHGLSATGPGVAADTPVTGSVDSTVNESVVLSGSVASGSDSITLEQYTVELLHP